MIFQDLYHLGAARTVRVAAVSSVIVLLTVVGSGEAMANAVVSGVRGSVMELFANKGDTAPIGQLSRAEGRALKSAPAPILQADGDWLMIEHNGNQYWVKAEQARESGNRPTLSCSAQLGGSSAGATRGIGEGCK